MCSKVELTDRGSSPVGGGCWVVGSVVPTARIPPENSGAPGSGRGGRYFGVFGGTSAVTFPSDLPELLTSAAPAQGGGRRGGRVDCCTRGGGGGGPAGGEGGHPSIRGPHSAGRGGGGGGGGNKGGHRGYRGWTSCGGGQTPPTPARWGGLEGWKGDRGSKALKESFALKLARAAPTAPTGFPGSRSNLEVGGCGQKTPRTYHGTAPGKTPSAKNEYSTKKSIIVRRSWPKEGVDVPTHAKQQRF